jgi:hypothetical protein
MSKLAPYESLHHFTSPDINTATIGNDFSDKWTENLATVSGYYENYYQKGGKLDRIRKVTWRDNMHVLPIFLPWQKEQAYIIGEVTCTISK